MSIAIVTCRAQLGLNAPEFRAVRDTNTHCTGGPVARKPVKRALRTQLPCYSKFQSDNFYGYVPDRREAHVARPDRLPRQIGLDAPLVQVEVSLGSGLPMFCIVGLPEIVVKESKERVRAALLNSHFEFPAGRITVNLAPADLPKEGGRFDLPIALGILIASQQIKPCRQESGVDAATEFYGELGLGGELRPTRGLLLAAAHASRHGHELIVPRASAHEALVAARTTVRAADHLREVCAHVEGKESLVPLAPLLATTKAMLSKSGVQGGCVSNGHEPPTAGSSAGLDLCDVRGQLHAKRALIIAAAGEHSLLMVGPPGSGKSMLAQRLAGLLPPLTEPEALEVASIASVSASGFNASEFGQRPFRCPHHSASGAALVGGGSRARPGEISLAHRGVLFLDELTVRGTCNRRVLLGSSRSRASAASRQTALRVRVCIEKGWEPRCRRFRQRLSRQLWQSPCSR
jgi:magnesium chelatase family protein